MITIDGQKMGKSLNNFINLEEFFSGNHEKLDRAYHPMTIRFFILQAHYRGTLDFSNSALAAAEKGFLKLVSAIQTLKNITHNKVSSFDIKKIEEKYYSSLNDDFNTPILIAHLFDSVKIINALNANKETLNKKDLTKFASTFEFFIVDILGLKPITQKNIKDNNIEGVMKILLELRNKAKQNKDFITADMIRDELDKISIQIKDGREGTTWNMKKDD
jgi:cysteinyl-tRNA synthetase